MSPADLKPVVGAPTLAGEMLRVIVFRCAHCGAALEALDVQATSLTCHYCAHRNVVPGQAVNAKPEPSNTRILTVLLGGLLGITLVVGVPVTLEWRSKQTDADHEVDLAALAQAAGERVSGLDLLSLEGGALMADGSLWVGCDHPRRLCGVDAGRAWLGSIALPPEEAPATTPRSAEAPLALAASGPDTLLVAWQRSLYSVAPRERRVRGRVHPEGLLPEETLACLAAGEGGVVWAVTSRDDLVRLTPGAERVAARTAEPLPRTSLRHTGCRGLAVDARGQLWVVPASEPAVYVLSAEGRVLRHHAPGGAGHYQGVAPLADGSAVVGRSGDSSELLRWGPSFEPLPGPKRFEGWRERRGWVGVEALAVTPAGGLVLVTSLGELGYWDNTRGRW